MNDKKKVIELLKESQDIILKHEDVFSPFETIRLAMIMRYFLSYIENGEEVSTSE